MFNLQSIAAEKLNYFLTDSLPASKDSVIQVLSTNIGQMQDKELLLTYAYINNRNYDEATKNAGIVAKVYPELGKFLLQLIALETAPKKAFSLLDNDANFSEVKTLANTKGNDGQPAAQALIKFLQGTDYYVPRILPIMDGSGSRLINTPIENHIVANSNFKVYPNPASQLVNVVYQNNTVGEEVQLQLINTLGRIVYQTNIKTEQQVQIPLGDLAGGIYMLVGYNGKTKVYQTKVVKVN